MRKELETGTIMFVPVPDDASDLTLPKIGIVDLYFRTDDEDYENGYISVTIPQGNWKLLGDSKQITEDDLSLIGLNLEAFNSLKESLRLDEGKHIVLFEAKK